MIVDGLKEAGSASHLPRGNEGGPGQEALTSVPWRRLVSGARSALGTAD